MTWTEGDQKLFVKALELYGSSAGADVWVKMARFIGTKTAKQVHSFCFDYLLQLQLVHDDKRSNINYTIDDLGGKWTLNEDAMFEYFLAVFTETEGGRWEKIAGALCERNIRKTPAQCEKRYLLLVNDINSILTNKEVSTKYYSKPIGEYLSHTDVRKVEMGLGASGLKLSDDQIITPLKRFLDSN